MISRERHLLGKVGPPPTLHNFKGGYSEKTLFLRNVVLNIGEKTPFFMKNQHFFGGRVFLLCSCGPKKDSKKARPCGVCRPGSFLAADMLGYTGKTLVWWEIGEKGPYSRYFSRVSCLFLLGSCGCKSDLERGTTSG